MSDLSKKVGILVATVIESFSMYWIAPYFPSVAKSQDIPFWLIGVIFSACPLMSLICSPSVPFLMERFGRKAVMLTGLFWLGIGNCVLILVLVSPVYWSILFSFLGRILIGLGYSWTIISKMAILISEFPQETVRMVALMESMLGIGMILGPILGSVVYGEMNFMYACLFFSALNFLMILVLYFLVGKLRDYEFLRKNPISLLDLVKKQKIALDALVQVIVMIAYGILIPSYGSHFTKYSLSETQAGYFYAICAFSYLVSSLLVSFLPSEWNKPRLMFFGTLVMAFGFLMIGPCTIIFPDTLLIAIIGLVVIGVGGGFMFVFCVPHMIEVAIEDYQFPKDDYLHDSLSKLNNVSMCIGDIIGPTFSTVMCSFIGFSNTANIFFIILIIFGLTYGVLSDAFWFKIVPSEDREVLNIKES